MTEIIKHEYDLETLVPERAPFQLYTPSAVEERPFRDALAYLVFKWQFFAQLLYQGMEIHYSLEVPSAAATDSHSIFLNPKGFEDLQIRTVPEFAFVMAHEVSHRVLNDLPMMKVWNKTKQVLLSSGRTLPYNHMLMNKAQDYRINAMLKSSAVGKMPACALFDQALSEKGMESSVEIYEKLFRDGKGGGGGQAPGKGGGGGHGGFDIHIAPSDLREAIDKGKREQEIVAAGQLAQRTQGTIPGALQRIIEEIVNPKVPWQQYLRTAMQRKVGSPKLDWRHRDRRLAGRDPSMFFAKRGHLGAGLIVIGGDNSGSIGPDEIKLFASEMSGILHDLNPEHLTVIWCDAAVTRVDELDELGDFEELFTKWKTQGVGGGGGTDFRPVFNHVNKLGVIPDMLVFFTDGMGTFPDQQPLYPVIWASIRKASQYPWGEVVDIEF